MAKKSFLVKSVLMSMLTAVTFSFASCSDDDLVDNNPQMPETSQSGGKGSVEPYGLCYYDFEGSDDVAILNADTTEISVKKALAEKLGISTFVNHPLGIWQAEARLPFARKVAAENLVGDMYILKVAPATVAELLGNTCFSSRQTSSLTPGNRFLISRDAAGIACSWPIRNLPCNSRRGPVTTPR
jgi:hypothetical protein